MEPPISPVLFALLLFLGMLTLLETGRRLGIRRRPKESEGEREAWVRSRVRCSPSLVC